MIQKTKPVRRSKVLAYIDYDGVALNEGKSYKQYRLDSRERKLLNPDTCKHRSVMVTQRCRCCAHVSVAIVKGVVALNSGLKR